MPDLRRELHLWRLERIRVGDLDVHLLGDAIDACRVECVSAVWRDDKSWLCGHPGGGGRLIGYWAGYEYPFAFLGIVARRVCRATTQKVRKIQRARTQLAEIHSRRKPRKLDETDVREAPQVGGETTPRDGRVKARGRLASIRVSP